MKATRHKTLRRYTLYKQLPPDLNLSFQEGDIVLLNDFWSHYGVVAEVTREKRDFTHREETRLTVRYISPSGGGLVECGNRACKSKRGVCCMCGTTAWANGVDVCDTATAASFIESRMLDIKLIPRPTGKGVATMHKRAARTHKLTGWDADNTQPVPDGSIVFINNSLWQRYGKVVSSGPAFRCGFGGVGTKQRSLAIKHINPDTGKVMTCPDSRCEGACVCCSTVRWEEEVKPFTTDELELFVEHKLLARSLVPKPPKRRSAKTNKAAK